jgi:hypothetical protein
VDIALHLDQDDLVVRDIDEVAWELWDLGRRVVVVWGGLYGEDDEEGRAMDMIMVRVRVRVCSG